MQPQPYRIFTASNLAAIQHAVNDSLSAWSDHWFSTGTPMTALSAATNAHVSPALPSDPGLCIERQTREGGCRILCSTSAMQQLYCNATGDRFNKATHEDANTLIHHLVSNMLNALLATLLPGHAIVPTDLPMHKGSGTVLLNVGDGNGSASILLSYALAQRLAGSTPSSVPRNPLISRKSVIGHGQLKVLVSAGHVELRLADLAELTPGHVIRLNLKTDQPFIMENATTGMKLCAAHLGQREHHKAVQLTQS